LGWIVTAGLGMELRIQVYLTIAILQAAGGARVLSQAVRARFT